MVQGMMGLVDENMVRLLLNEHGETLYKGTKDDKSTHITTTILNHTFLFAFDFGSSCIFDLRVIL